MGIIATDDRRIIYAEVLFLIFSFWLAGWPGIFIHVGAAVWTAFVIWWMRLDVKANEAQHGVGR